MKARLLIAATLSFIASAFAHAEQLNARGALDMISQYYGADTTSWLVEMRGHGGQPQPQEWDIMVFDPKAPRLLHWYRAVENIAADGGYEMRKYPLDLPVGYFSKNDLKLDSKAAFTIAEAQARKAKIGFNRCDYFLRVREYSREPIWRLELYDNLDQLTGKVYLSGATGDVLRTLWVYRDQAGQPIVADSAVPGVRTGPDYSQRENIRSGAVEGPVTPDVTSIPGPPQPGTDSPAQPKLTLADKPPAKNPEESETIFPGMQGGSSRTAPQPPAPAAPSTPPVAEVPKKQDPPAVKKPAPVAEKPAEKKPTAEEPAKEPAKQRQIIPPPPLPY